MDFDKEIDEGYLKIYCSNSLEKFAYRFMDYYNSQIDNIKKELMVEDFIFLIVAITDDKAKTKFVYGNSDFSGIFTDTGAFAYINLNGEKTEDYIMKGLMHELVHHIYKYYVYGADKKRITWVDEGIAQLFSGQKEELKDKDLYLSFVRENLNHCNDINLNSLNHDDRSFGNNNGYNLSYIAVRYLYENNSHEGFIEIIKDTDELLKIGKDILKTIFKKINNYHSI